MAASRAGEPWYADAAAALARVQAGSEDPADEAGIAPFRHGRWDDEVAAYDAWMDEHRIDEAWDFVAEGAFDPPATRAALAALDVPVLVLAGSVDVGNPVAAMAEVAALFPRGEVVVQDGAGHFPWVDDPAAFVALVRDFVAASSEARSQQPGPRGVRRNRGRLPGCRPAGSARWAPPARDVAVPVVPPLRVLASAPGAKSGSVRTPASWSRPASSG